MRIAAVLEEPELTWLKIGLQAMGHKSAQLEIHGSDLDALQAIYVSGRPDLLVLDLDLPGVIGLETVRAMRQQKDLEALPVVLAATEEIVLGARAAARTQSVTKPVHPDDWSTAIRAVLSAPLLKPAAAPPEPPAAPEPSETLKRASRKAERKSFETPCLVSGTGSKVKGVLRDISLTGAKITLYGELKVNSLATLILGVPGTIPLKIVHIKVRVARRTPDGYGLSFAEMDSDTRSFVLAVTQR